MYRSPFIILQKKIGFAQNPQPLRHSLPGCFSNAIYSLFVLLTLQVVCQGQAEHETTFKTS